MFGGHSFTPTITMTGLDTVTGYVGVLKRSKIKRNIRIPKGPQSRGQVEDLGIRKPPL